MFEKRGCSVSIVGGADGPTSIFVAGKNKNIPLKERIKRYFYKIKRQRVEKTITANPHTLEEVVQYLQDTYGAVELSRQSREYLEQFKNLKESLILRHKPELLGELAKLKHPVVHNQEAIQAFVKQLELRSNKAESIPDEVFPMDFHVYQIKLSGIGEIEFCIDTIWSIFGSSYSGSRKGMKKLQRISKDVHMYYGVTEEDIRNRSERYKAMVATAST